MSRFWPTAFLAAAAASGGGCAALFGPPAAVEAALPEPGSNNGGNAVTADYVRLSGEIDRLTASMPSLLSAFEKIEKDHSDQIKDLGRRLENVESAVARLIQHLDRLGKGSPDWKPGDAPVPPGPASPEAGSTPALGNAPPPTAGAPAPPAPPVIDTAALLAEAVGRMKTEMPALDQQDLAKHLSVASTEAVPRLMEELRLNSGSYVFVRNFSAVVSKLPLEIIRGPLEATLENDRLREVAADTLGLTGDPSVASALLRYAGSQDENFRSHLAEALTRCKHVSGVAMLVSQLRSKDKSHRDIALLTLKKLNGGYTFGYRLDLGPDEPTNLEAIARWDSWYASRKDQIFQTQ